jgi:hypothetical protein
MYSHSLPPQIPAGIVSRRNRRYFLHWGKSAAPGARDPQEEYILALVDTDDKCYAPHQYLLRYSKVKMLTSSPKDESRRTWLTQFVKRLSGVFVVDAWCGMNFISQCSWILLH